MDFRICENGMHFWLHVTEKNLTQLLALGRERTQIPMEMQNNPCTELVISGDDTVLHHGHKQVSGLIGWRLQFEGLDDERNSLGRYIRVRQSKDGLFVTTHYQFFDGIPAVRVWTELVNHGAPITLENVTSLSVSGLLSEEKPLADDAILHVPHNSWRLECQWCQYTLSDLGFEPAAVPDTLKRLAYSSTGTWSACEYLPMGALSDPDGKNAWVWQIEGGSSWAWEIGDYNHKLYLNLSGATFLDNGWSKRLETGERFVTVPCALAFAQDGFEAGIQALTRYRRKIRRPNADNAHPSVIFNDYMNCLFADPTTEKEKPLIEAAAKAGCKYYCVDAGWYHDGDWWNNVGQWLPSKQRFPGGLKEVLDDIRAHGMIPGLWLEPEVMGIACPLVDELPDEWFFMRNGKRVKDHERYQLDFSNPEVRAYADSIMDRLVNEYGAGYIKIDYNIDAGVGTDTGNVNPGEGLRRHTEGLMQWIDALYERYPNLIIENCSSGGMRMEYAFLSRHSIQSVTDQTDYRIMAHIACNCPTAVTPEQAAIWSYPLRDGDIEESCFNMVNAMLLRIHQSGHLAEMSPERLEIIKEGLRTHTEIVDELKDGVPFWPHGLPRMSDTTFCMGIRCEKNSYLAVWNTAETAKAYSIPLSTNIAAVSLLYPTTLPRSWKTQDNTLEVEMQSNTASIFKLQHA